MLPDKSGMVRTQAGLAAWTPRTSSPVGQNRASVGQDRASVGQDSLPAPPSGGKALGAGRVAAEAANMSRYLLSLHHAPLCRSDWRGERRRDSKYSHLSLLGEGSSVGCRV